MGKRLYGYLSVAVILFFLAPPSVFAAVTPQVKISVFNFRTVNLEASGYGTTVTNMLMDSLKAEPFLVMLDRKELESFLSLNDLQQDDNMDHVIDIGTRLGLNVIVIGSVEKKGSVIAINSKAIQIEQRKLIFTNQSRIFGDPGLEKEVRKLSRLITEAITRQASVTEDKGSVVKPPVNLQKRMGNKKISISWEDPPDAAAAGYEVFRSKAEAGPYDKVALVNRPEYIDQDVEKNTTYYYKIRSFSGRGVRSPESAVISAEMVLSPNPPIILRADGSIGSITLTWSSNPMRSDDPLKVKGFKVYRAKAERGPYREVANIIAKDLGLSGDAATTLDKLSKAIFIDKGLGDGQEYYYQITAYNEKDLESEYSCPLGATTVPTITGLSAQGNMIREVSLTWDHITAPVVKGYYVYRNTAETGGDFTRITKIDASAVQNGKVRYVDKDGLEDKTRYFYRITACEEAGAETSPSVVVAATTKSRPVTPRGLRTQALKLKEVPLSWSPNPEGDVDTYHIYRNSDAADALDRVARIIGEVTGNKSAEFSRIATIQGKTDYVDKGLKDGYVYNYRLQAEDRDGLLSDLSPTVSAQTKPKPDSPEEVSGSLRDGAVQLKWKPVAIADLAYYTVYEKRFFQLVKIDTVKETHFRGEGPAKGKSKTYVVTATDQTGLESDASPEVTVLSK